MRYKTGIGMLIISTILFVVAIVIPFIEFSAKTKALIIGGVLIVAEVMFWLGALLVGKEAIAKFKQYFNLKKWFQTTNDKEYEDEK